jgi:hypothetical protein
MRFRLLIRVLAATLSATLSVLGAQSPGRGPARTPGPIAPAVFESRSVYATLGGRLAPLRRIDQTATVAGIVTDIRVQPGSRVAEGDPLLSITRNVLGETYLPFVVRARISGLVSDLRPVVGSEVSAQAVVASLIDDSSLTLEALVSDRDANRIRALGVKDAIGHSAEGLAIKGRLTGISLEPDYSTGLFAARFLFPLAPGASAGTVLFMEIPVEIVKGLFVPRTLIQRRFGRSMLWTLDAEDKLALKEVRTGPVFGDEVCVTGGIKEGEPVLRLVTGKEREGMERGAWETLAREAGSGTAGGPGGGPGGGPR